MRILEQAKRSLSKAPTYPTADYFLKRLGSAGEIAKNDASAADDF